MAGGASGDGNDNRFGDAAAVAAGLGNEDLGYADLGYMGLGYVGLGAPDSSAWCELATGVCGLMPSRVLPGAEGPIRMLQPEAEGQAPDGSVYFKMDDLQWRVAVHPREESGLLYLGLELRDERAFDRLCKKIDACGADIRLGTEEERVARAVGCLAVVHDPAGHRVELFASPVRDRDFVSPHGVEFKTGAFGLGHVVLYVPEIQAALDFYRNVLGFERSDFMHFGPNGMGIHFLRCTARHHSIALLQIGDLRGLQHLMFETTSLDDVGKSLDRALKAGIPITSGLGRHRNDGTVSYYMQGPIGFDVEIGWDGVMIDEHWVENEFAGGGDDWGHHGLDAASLAPKESK